MPQPQLPPPNKMIPELRAADHTYAFFRELVARDSPRFQALNPIKRGTPYATGQGADQRTIDAFPTLFFVRETVPIGSNTVAGMTQHDLVIWEWSSTIDAESVENAEISYLGDAVANPVYARVSTLRRSIYEANPTLTPGTATLTGLIGIKVTNGGSGYSSAPTVTIAGGLGAAAEAVIDAAGAVSHVIITKESSGYDSASLPAISFSGGGGTGAAATAIVQPKTAVLTSQKKSEFLDSDPRSHEFVMLTRVYETLPGPDIVSTAVTDGGERVTTTRTRVLASSVTTSNSTAGGTWTRTFKEPIEGSSVVAWKVVVTQTDVFSKLFFSKRRDDTVPERFKASVPEITTKVVLQGAASAPTLATGDLFRSEQQLDAFTFERTITNRDISSLPTLEGQKYDEELNVLIPYTEQVVAAGSAIGDASTEVTPLGGGLDLKVVYDLTAIASAFASFELVFPGKANLNLPDILVDLQLIEETHSGEGDAGTPTFSGSWSGHGSYSLSPSARAQASQSVIPELIPTILPVYGNNKNTTRCVFLLPMPASVAEVLAKLSSLLGDTVLDWPDFHPAPIFAELTGRQVSLEVTASYHIQDGGSDDSSEHAEMAQDSKSLEVGMTVKSKEISPTIHGGFFDADPQPPPPPPSLPWPYSGLILPTDIAGVDIAPRPPAIELTADAYYHSRSETAPIPESSVVITNAGATPGDIAIPNSGVRLLRCDGSPYRYNHAMFHAEVFDFADL